MEDIKNGEGEEGWRTSSNKKVVVEGCTTTHYKTAGKREGHGGWRRRRWDQNLVRDLIQARERERDKEGGRRRRRRGHSWPESEIGEEGGWGWGRGQKSLWKQQQQQRRRRLREGRGKKTLFGSVSSSLSPSFKDIEEIGKRGRRRTRRKGLFSPS